MTQNSTTKSTTTEHLPAWHRTRIVGRQDPNLEGVELRAKPGTCQAACRRLVPGDHSDAQLRACLAEHEPTQPTGPT